MVLASTPPTSFLLKIQYLQPDLYDLLLTEGLLEEFISLWLIDLLLWSKNFVEHFCKVTTLT